MYFGQPIHEFTEGLQGLYEDLLAMQAAMIDATLSVPGVMRSEYLETVLDEDRVDACKLMAVRMRVEG